MARVLRQTTVARDGMHNGFTDLLFWQDCYWVSYRKATKHASIDGEACLSVSMDRHRFREAARIKVPGDNRDPKLIALDDGRLAMYFPTWIGGHEKRHLQPYIAFSEDGFSWEKPQPIYKPHWWLWRIVQHDGRFYSVASTYMVDDTPDQTGVRRSDLLVSDDLLHWEVLSHIEGVNGVETALHFCENGELWLLSRNYVKGAPALLSIARPPYTSWETKQLNHLVHAAVILEHDDKLYVSGRRDALHDGPHFAFRTAKRDAKYASSLGIWELHRDRLEPVLYIPACGDSGYPGLIKDPQGRICLSYYSEHAYRMGVIPERYRQSPDDENKWIRLNQNDVYFAEVELS